MPSIPDRSTIKRYLDSVIETTEVSILSSLSPDTKLAIALDCWTSPFQQAFMAITGYFIDDSWNFQEVLLGFEPLSQSHTGSNLGKKLMDVLEKYQISQRILAITTDNASNNKTLVQYLREKGMIHTLSRVPCMAHVIQICLNDLLHDLKLQPKNEVTERFWTDQKKHSLGKIDDSIVSTLKKVYNPYPFFILYFFNFFLDPGLYSLYPRKSTTSKCFQKYERKHQWTPSCPRCPDSVELDICYAFTG